MQSCGERAASAPDKFATIACSPEYFTTRAGGAGGHHLDEVLQPHEGDDRLAALPQRPELLGGPDERVAHLGARLEFRLELAAVGRDRDRSLSSHDTPFR